MEVAKALSTLATTVAEFGDCRGLGDCRRQSPFSVTVPEFGDSSRFRLQIIVAVYGDYSRRSRRL